MNHFHLEVVDESSHYVQINKKNIILSTIMRDFYMRVKSETHIK
jgi:hypothetical protein